MAYMSIDSQELKTQYEARLMSNVQKLSLKRANIGITQKQMAEYTGKSIRSIVRFENYQSLDPYLVFCYSKILEK